MSKEASADLWKMLYNLADELKELKPWEDLWDMDLIGIQENGRDEPVFCSVIGKETREKGIALYDGTGGLASFQKTARAASASQIEYRISEQQALVCFWGSRIDVPEEQQKMIRNLEKKYHGKNNWPCFFSLLPRFAPCTPDETEVRLLVETFVQLVEAVKALREERVKVNFEEGEFCFRYFDLEQMNWMTAPARLPYIEEKYETVEVTDETLLQHLAQQPDNGMTLLVDTAYLHGAMKDEQYDRPVDPLLLLAADGDSGQFVHGQALSPEEEEGMAAVDFLIRFIESKGKPEKVMARNPYILQALEQFCGVLEITLQEAPLTEMDSIIETMRKQADQL